jgi:hypothetical protein
MQAVGTVVPGPCLGGFLGFGVDASRKQRPALR